MATRKSNETVESLPGLAPWAGGKRNLAGRLVERIEAVPHHTYAEPFVGMGGVFFRRRRRTHNEVVNDRAGDVVNLFRVVKHHPDALARETSLMLCARREFARLVRTDAAVLTDVQRAARFYCLQRWSYGGEVRGRTFPAARTRSQGMHPDMMRRHLALAARRLARVTIEDLDFETFIRRYDGPATLFYLDPPYWGLERIYGAGLFERADHARLATLLRGLKGRFIMSLNDRPEVRELYRWAKVEAAAVSYTVNHRRATKRTHELIISTPIKAGRLKNPN